MEVLPHDAVGALADRRQQRTVSNRLLHHDRRPAVQPRQSKRVRQRRGMVCPRRQDQERCGTAKGARKRVGRRHQPPGAREQDFGPRFADGARLVNDARDCGCRPCEVTMIAGRGLGVAADDARGGLVGEVVGLRRGAGGRFHAHVGGVGEAYRRLVREEEGEVAGQGAREFVREGLVREDGGVETDTDGLADEVQGDYMHAVVVDEGDGGLLEGADQCGDALTDVGEAGVGVPVQRTG